MDCCSCSTTRISYRTALRSCSRESPTHDGDDDEDGNSDDDEDENDDYEDDEHVVMMMIINT